MSLPPHREKDAKVEGRDPPETAKETMAPFKSLLGRLLKVKPDEVAEQQQRYELEKHEAERITLPKPRKKRLAMIAQKLGEQPVKVGKK